MAASTLPVMWMAPGATPGRLTTGTTPPTTVGNWNRGPSASGFSGLSEAPKSTVLAWICLMPPPEPMA